MENRYCKCKYFEIKEIMDRLFSKMDKNGDVLGNDLSNCAILYMYRSSSPEIIRYHIRLFPYIEKQVEIYDKKIFGNTFKVVKSNTCPLICIDLLFNTKTHELEVLIYSMPLNLLVPLSLSVPCETKNIKIINKNTISYLLMINKLISNGSDKFINNLIEEVKSYE